MNPAFTFAWPLFLYGFALLPILAVFLWWTARCKRAALRRLGDMALIAKLAASVNTSGRRWKMTLWFLALTCIILALARPQWGSEIQSVQQKGLQVMLVLDVSPSMRAQDVQPDRLERAKIELAGLMDSLGSDEVGLVLFSGSAFIQFPLTSDYATARSFLDAARPELISRPGTAIGSALRVALTGFDARRSSQKVIVLISDGEDHQPDSMQMAQKAADEGVLIHAIGVGSAEGAPIPLRNAKGEVTGFKQKDGQVVLSRLDENILRQIASAGKGNYYRLTPGSSEINSLVLALSTLKRADLETRFETNRIERFQIFLWAALLSLVIIEFIPDRKRVK